MEIAGLAVGLASLYCTCIEAVHRVESYKNFETETGQLSAQFKADKAIFQRWADKVGIRHDKLSDTYDRRLDNPGIASAVREVLLSLQRILEATDGAQNKFRHNNTNKSLSSRGSTFAQGSHAVSTSSSRKDKLFWALGGKQKFTTLVNIFSTLVEKLENLIQSDGYLEHTKLCRHSEKVGLEGA